MSLQNNKHQKKKIHIKKENHQGKNIYHYKTFQETIQRGDSFYMIEQTDDESRETYLDRVNYIINILENDVGLTIEKATLLSYVWRNIVLYKMSYPSTLLRTLPFLKF